MNRYPAVALLVLLIFAIGCTQAPPPEPPDTRAADESAVRRASADMMAAAQAKDAEGVSSVYAPDSLVHYVNFPPMNKQQAHDAWAQVMANAGYSVSWSPQRIDVARSGDLAFEQGTYEFTQHDARGRPVVERGTYVQAWKKQGDGAWKIFVNTSTATPEN